ncbi:hypothetical protein KJ365_14265 [Glaciecola sp. XM2]|nr:hypothetical protein [Glaciecola sp. XM2]
MLRKKGNKVKTSVEISLYPLDDNYTPIVLAFIERLQDDPDLDVVISPSSTFVTGEHHNVMTTLATEFEITFRQVGQAVFVCKFMNADAMME